MLVIQLRFPAGRYHATAWGRHVNEGEAEWPPSPYRLVRALFDAWKRKLPGWPAARVEDLLARLAGEAPRYRLPPATLSHTRSYLSKNQTDPSDRALVFDGFVVVDRHEAVLMGWPDVELGDGQLRDLDELLGQLNYLGRSESWIDAAVVRGIAAVDWDCEPAAWKAEGELVRVACVVPRNEYSPLGHNLIPKNWFDGLAFSTSEQMSARISDPPALRFIDYRRPRGCLEAAVARHPARKSESPQAVLYSLDSKVLPLLTDAVMIAERARRCLMGIHKRLTGDGGQVSERFSGKDREGIPLTGHRHTFLLPMDRDRDGRIDHLLAVCREGFDALECTALDEMHSLWGVSALIQLVPVRWGAMGQILEKTRRVRSMTPFVPGRHYRRGRGEFSQWLATEVKRECRNHGLPEPFRIEPLERCKLPGRSYRWLEFRRSRKGEEPGLGYGFELEFAEPVNAPLALGQGCHFGLGQFVPAIE